MAVTEDTLKIRYEVSGDGDIKASFGDAAAGAAQTARSVEDLDREFNQLTARLFPMARKLAEVQQLQANLNEQLRRGTITTEQHANATQKLEARQRQLERALRNTGDELDDLSKKGDGASRMLRGLTGMVAGLGAGLSIGALFRGVIDNTIEAERVSAQLDATLRSTQQAAGLSRAELLAMAGAYQQVTTYGDDAVASAQTILLTYTNIGREVFPRALEAVLDMSTALGQDLKSSAEQVGRALGTPTRATEALSQQGFVFTRQQKDLIRTLEETGRVAEAQAIILEELEESYGGSARAAAQAFGGALAQLREAFGDLLEGESGGDGLNAATAGVRELTSVLSDPGTRNAFIEMTGLALQLAGGMAKLVAYSGEFAGFTFGTRSTTDVGSLEQQLRNVDALIAERQSENVVQSYLRTLSASPANPLGFAANLMGNPRAQGLDELRELREQVRRELDEAREAAQRESVASRISFIGGGLGPDAAGAGGVSSRVEQLVADLDRQAEAYGKTRIELLELNKAKALAEAANADEQAALTESYDALIAVVRAEDARAEALKKGRQATQQAAREEKRLAKERADAEREFATRLEDTAAQLGGPLAQAELEHTRRKRELIALAERAGISSAELSAALEQEAKRHDANATAIKRQTDLAGRVLDDLTFELHLLSLSNVEREKAIALRYANADAASAEGRALGDVIDRLDKERRVVEVMDDFRDAAHGAFRDFISGAKEADEAASAFFQNLALRLADRALLSALDGWFGERGTSQTGSAGGWLGLVGSFFGGLFGGGRAAGGPVQRGHLYEINEHRQPEILNWGGRDFLMMGGGDGNVQPLRMGGPAPMASTGAGFGDLHVTTVVNVEAGSAQTQTQGSDDQQARALGQMITERVKGVLVEESRQGGLLWQMRNGGRG